MKHVLFAALAAVAMTTGAHAQSVQQRYQGTFFVTAANTACTASPTTAEVGDNYVFVFRTEATKQLFALFGGRRAMSYAPSTDARFAASGSHKSVSIGGGAAASNFTGAYSGFVLAPATFATTTQYMSLKGTLTNFDGVTGCTVTFTASGVRRPGF